jgi:L-lactate dehydrogenase complex protein LldF
MSFKKQFHIDARKTANDPVHRRIISYNMKQYDLAVVRGKSEFIDLDLAKKRASSLKEVVLSGWYQLLLDFENACMANGTEVYWASDKKELDKVLLGLMDQIKPGTIVKSKSMTTEEIDLNHTLEQRGIEVVETDLGEFIVQVAGEKPYHIVTPAMHKSKEDVAHLFNRLYGLPENSTPGEITAFVRKKLREKFTQADVGITGANFLIAGSGAVALTENEGNALMSLSFPKVHIVIAGIEKIIPSLSDLAHFWPILATHGTGQKMTSYSTVVKGPRESGESTGPERMIVILLDNGRTNLYNTKEHYSALKCIRCGSCLNACPVYRTIGGYTFNTTYSGPIGSVISPHFNGFRNFGHLSFACSLCGACRDECPVNIDLPSLLLKNREIYNRKKRVHFENAVVWKAGIILQKRVYMDALPPLIKNKILRPFLVRLWGKERTFPVFVRSFSQTCIENSKT